MSNHIDSDLINELMSVHAYVPKLSHGDAVKMIADIIGANNAEYGRLVAQIGRPENKKAKEIFYKTLREKINEHFDVRFTPFIPTDIGQKFREASQTRNTSLFAEFVTEAATLYQSNAADFDRFARGAGYMEVE